LLTLKIHQLKEWNVLEEVCDPKIKLALERKILTNRSTFAIKKIITEISLCQ
jgi:hypothetical protein